MPELGGGAGRASAPFARRGKGGAENKISYKILPELENTT
jgi:hypothetical protein